MSSSKTSVETISKRIVVSGKVQGVGYRYSLAEQARLLNIQGWCRNLPDGRVEACLQGSPDAMKEIVSWMQQGPAQAAVNKIEIENQAILEPMLGETIQAFEIRK